MPTHTCLANQPAPLTAIAVVALAASIFRVTARSSRNIPQARA